MLRTLNSTIWGLEKLGGYYPLVLGSDEGELYSHTLVVLGAPSGRNSG